MKTKNLFLCILLLLSVSAFAQKKTNDTISVNEIVVTGTKTEIQRNNVPLSVSAVNSSEIEQSGETAILSAISKLIPGVFVTERGLTGYGLGTGSAGKISIRGVNGEPNSEVLVLIDGHPQYQGIFGHPIPDAYVSSDVERVEVIRGPASVLYGSNAMGGVINIITKKQKKDGFSANAGIAYGSYNTQKYMASVGFKKKALSLFASVNHDKSDGQRDNSDFKITNGYVKADLRLSENFSLMADYNIAKIKSTDPGTEFSPSIFSIDVTRGKTSASLFNNFGKTEGAIKWFYNFGTHDFSNGWHSTDKNTGIMIYQSVHLFTGNTITAGFDNKKYGGKAQSGETVLGNHTISENAIYLTCQQNIGQKLTLNIGGRYENNQKYGDFFVPQAGVAWNVAKQTTVKASASKGFRSPTFKDFYLFGIGNEDLKPEELWNYDISVLQSAANNKLNFELSVFKIDAKNIIQVNPALRKNDNTGKFENWGIEFAGKWKACSFADVQLNYTYTERSVAVVGVPKNNLYAAVLLHAKKLQFNLNGQFISDLYTTTQTSAQTQEYFMLNSRVNYSVLKNLNIWISGENLLDKKYEINYGYPMPGATVMMGINVSI